MTITFSCANCGKGQKVSRELAGKRVRCRQCGTVMAVPVPRGQPRTPAPLAVELPSRVMAELDEELAKAPARTTRTDRTRTRSSRRNRRLYLIVGSAVAVPALLLGLILLPQFIRRIAIDMRSSIQAITVETSSSGGGASRQAAQVPSLPMFVVRPEFQVMGQSLQAGTAFLVKLESVPYPILLTALHLLGPAGGLERDIPSESLWQFVPTVTLHDFGQLSAFGRCGSGRPAAQRLSSGG